MYKLLALAAVMLSACSSPTVRMSADSVVPVAHGSITGKGSNIGAQASFGELGVEDVEQVMSSPRVEFRGVGGTLSLGYMPASYAGDGRLVSDLEFGGEFFHESSEVHTELGADFLTARLTANLLETEPFSVGVGVGLCGLALKMRVEESEGSGEGEVDELIPLTMAIARVDGELGDFNFEASYGIHSTSRRGGERRLQDIDARMSYSPEGMSGALVLGYRAIRMEGVHGVDGQSAGIDVVFGGPYLGLSLGF